MEWLYKLSRKEALIKIIYDNFEKSKEIDVYDLANDIEKYIRKTHLKRKLSLNSDIIKNIKKVNKNE